MSAIDVFAENISMFAKNKVFEIKALCNIFPFSNISYNFSLRDQIHLIKSICFETNLSALKLWDFLSFLLFSSTKTIQHFKHNAHGVQDLTQRIVKILRKLKRNKNMQYFYTRDWYLIHFGLLQDSSYCAVQYARKNVSQFSRYSFSSFRFLKKFYFHCIFQINADWHYWSSSRSYSIVVRKFYWFQIKIVFWFLNMWLFGWLEFKLDTYFKLSYLYTNVET